MAVQTLYRGSRMGHVTQIEYLPPKEEEEFTIANTLAEEGTGRITTIACPRVVASRLRHADLIDYVDVDPVQMTRWDGAYTVLEHDDANRAPMGANMQS